GPATLVVANEWVSAKTKTPSRRGGRLLTHLPITSATRRASSPLASLKKKGKAKRGMRVNIFSPPPTERKKKKRAPEHSTPGRLYLKRGLMVKIEPHISIVLPALHTRCSTATSTALGQKQA